MLDERQRSLATSRQSLNADRDRAVNEQTLSKERLTEAEGEVARVQAEFEEANERLKSTQKSFELRQADRSGGRGKVAGRARAGHILEFTPRRNTGASG